MNPVPRSELRLGALLAEGGEGRVFEVRSSPGEPLLGNPDPGHPNPGHPNPGHPNPGHPNPGHPNPGNPGRQRVYKELRRPCPVPQLSSLVDFPSRLATRDAPLSARVLTSSAWPVSVVVGEDPSIALGTLLPRAPLEFWVRHRDGTSRLASLSYLANDPDRIEVAYGVMLPAPGAPERVALVYALARLLDAWQRAPASQSGAEGALSPQVVHGDLSAKNVLWSLNPAPAVYVLDCDGAAVITAGRPDSGAGSDDEPGTFDRAQVGNGAEPPVGSSPPAPTDPVLAAPAPKRYRATTPNWGDPALKPGALPTAASDRYLLAITFLRVVGAAHFPIQGHQRSVAKVNVDLELPRSWRKLADMPGLWGLCERSLSLVNAADRPEPAEWVAHLEELLAVLSAPDLAASVRQAQGDPAPAASPAGGASRTLTVPTVTVPDVVVRPVLRHRAPSTWRLISAGAPTGVGGEMLPGVAGGRGLTRSGAPNTVSGAGGTGAAPAPLSPRQMLAAVMVTWGAAHRAAARWVRSPGRRAYGARRLAAVLVLDLAAACVAVFVVAMIISPWIGL